MTPNQGPRGPAAAGAAPVGQMVGGYRITGLLGEGGMGIVYEAEQQLPRRKVALKVIRWSGRANESQLRLFQREAEALARLRHPGIAAIYEAGVTPEGQHFFAMELVRGRPFSALLEEWRGAPPPDRAALRERLTLFVELCDAISYAHQNGVIHRDLKPSNILVTDAAGDSTSSGSLPRARVLDFGLARITDLEGAERITRTEDHSIRGTLGYMSPEQAQGNPEQVDFRSDIYSLGVVLYEMLTGRLPYDLGRKSLIESLRAIGEETPARPGLLNRALAGDLETILLKALEKPPGRRYQSVIALSEDIQRHLNDLPIQARPATLAYLLLKLARRHRAATLLGAGLLLASLAGAAGITVMMVRARHAAAEARLEAETAEQVTRFLTTLFRVSNPSEARSNSITARELLDAGAARIDTSLADQPAVRGRLLTVMGDVYRTMGLYKQARPLLERGLATSRTVLSPDDPSLARSEHALGTILRRLGEFDEAKGHYQRSLEIREKVYGPEHPDVASSLTGLANISLEIGELDTALVLYERCIRIVEKTKGPEAPELATYLANLSLLHRTRDEYAAALPPALRALAIEEKALGPDHPTVAEDLTGLGSAYTGLNRYAEACSVLTRALRIQERVLDPGHLTLAETLGELGKALEGAERYDESLRVQERALGIFRAALGDDSQYAARVRDNLSGLLHRMGRPREALVYSTAAVATLERVAGADHPALANALGHHAENQVALGHPAEGRATMERALRIRLAAFGASAYPTLEMMKYLAPLCVTMGDDAAARRYYQTAAAAMDTVPAWADTSWASFMADGAALWRKAGVADSVALLESRRDLIAARATTAAQRAPQAGSR